MELPLDLELVDAKTLVSAKPGACRVWAIVASVVVGE
jgi:hypothetical protein